MTKQEKLKCDELLVAAIQYLQQADLRYEQMKQVESKEDKLFLEKDGLCKQNYAEGIYDALSAIGYTGTLMKKFDKIIKGE